MTDYTRTASGAIQTRIQAAGLSVVYQAANVRKERTGVHATVTVGLQPNGKGTVICDEDTYNVARHIDRERLINAIYKRPEFKKLFEGAEYPQTRMSLDLMLFQRGLWEYELGQHEPQRRAGATDREAPRFLVKPFVIYHGGTILFAPPGTGKSWAGQIIAVLVDEGITRFFNTEQVPAMFVNLERSERSLDIRFGDINDALGLPRDRPLLRLDKRGAAFTDIADSVERTVKREGVGLVVVDSLSRMGLGKMVDDDVANRGMDALNALGCAWLVLAHTPRADATHTFGSQMFDAAADLTVQLLADEKSKQDTLGLGLKLVKHNDVPPEREAFQIALEFDAMGLTRIRRAMTGEFTIIDAERAQPSPAELVKAYVLTNGAVDATTVEEETGVPRGTVSKLFNGPGYRKVRREGHKVLFGVESEHVEVSESALGALPRTTSGHTHVSVPPTHSRGALTSEAEESPF